MDDALRARLERVEEQIDTLRAAEHEFLTLDGSKRGVAAQLFLKADGKSIAEREAQVYASQEWKDFTLGHVEAESKYNYERRRLELRLKAYDAEHATYKVENSAIVRQK